MNMTGTVHLMGNVVQQSEAPSLNVSPCSTLEAEIVHQSEAPDYMINGIHSKTNDKYSACSKALYEMFDFMASVVHPCEVPDIHDDIHSTPDARGLMANVVHQSEAPDIHDGQHSTADGK